MNPSGSSAEQQGDPSWPGEQWYHHASIGGGLDNRTYSGGRLDWDWENAMLLSQQHAGGGGGATDDDHEHKLQTTAAIMGSAPRTFNGIIPAALATNYPPHSMGMFGPQSIRSLATIDGSSTFPSSLHGALGSNPNFSFLAANGGHGDFRSSTMDQRRHLFGVMSFQEQKGHLLSDIVKRESDLCAGDAPARIGLNLGVRTYFSTEDTLGRLVRRPRMNSPLAQVPLCQAEGCRADLSNAKHYHRRHKVCELHSKAANVIAGGQTQRFCQQCSRFHVLSEFDDGKRSCRKRLADHNRRRRKPQPTNASMGGTKSEPLALVQKEENELSTTSSRSVNQSASAPPETRALLSAISLSPSVTLMNTKRQIPALSGNTEEAMYKYLQGAGQTGTQLSLSSMGAGLGSDNQALCQNANQRFNGIEPSVPWLRPASESRPDINGSVTRNLNLQHLMCNKTDQSPRAAGSSSSVQIFSSSFQNLMPINSSKDMSNSDWLIGREQAAQFEVDIPLEGHQVLSLLEAPTSLREVRNEGRAQIAPMEFLQQRSSLSGNDGDDSQAGSGQHSDRQFPELQGLRPFKSSIYDSSHNIL